MARHRYTVSLVVSGRVATEIDGMRRALGAESLRRIPPHITLIPPVNVRDVDATDVMELLRAVAATGRPIAVELGPPATFWPASPVVYLAVSGAPEPINSLRGRLLTGPLAPPAGRREREFVPHVTIDQRADPARIEPALEALADYRERVVFESVTLLEQSPEERVWTVVAEVPLGAAAVVARGGLELEIARPTRLDTVTAQWAADRWSAYSTGAYGADWSPDRPFSVTARRHGTLVGLAGGDTRGAVCELSRLIVDPAVRGEGIGGHLLRDVEALAIERGCGRVRLRTIDGGDAERFYAGRGYRRTVVLPEWREGRDFVVMERTVGLPGGG